MPQKKSEGVITPVDSNAVASASWGGSWTVAPSGQAKPQSKTSIVTAEPDAWFGPLQPLQPMAPAGTGGRQWDYPFGRNLSYTQRAEQFRMLRALSYSLPILRIVIEKRKEQIKGWSWDIQTRLIGKDKRSAGKPGKGEDPGIAKIRNLLRRPDRRYSFHTWLGALLEDMLVIDAATVYPRRTRGGDLFSLDFIDGSTIFPLVGGDGRAPLPEDGPAYQQVLHGIVAADFTLDELRYMPKNIRTSGVYGFSPVEWIVLTVNTALRRDVYNLEYYNSGTLPEMFGTLPEGWTTDQIKGFQDYFDTLMSGQLAQRRKLRFMPFSFKTEEVRQPPLKDQYDEWLARIVCAAFSIPPTAFVVDNNRATAQTIQISASQEGIEPLQNWIKDFMDAFIQGDMGYDDLEFVWAGEDKSDPLIEAQTNQIYVAMGAKSIDEVRTELGLDPYGIGPTVAAPPVPLKEAYDQALENIKNPPVPPPIPGAPAAPGGSGVDQGGNPPPKGADAASSSETKTAPPPKPAQSERAKNKGPAANKAADVDPATLYVSRPLVNGGAFIAWAKDQGFATTLPADDLHVTIGFSRELFDHSDLAPMGGKVLVSGGSRSLKQFGDAVVLCFDAPQLADRWQELCDAGASWDHDGYKPHVTITYDAGDVDLDEVEPYAGPLVFGGEVFKPVNEDWADGVVEAVAPVAEVAKSGASPKGGAPSVTKFNENHDERGRFATGDGAATGAKAPAELKDFSAQMDAASYANGVSTQSPLTDAEKAAIGSYQTSSLGINLALRGATPDHPAFAQMFPPEKVSSEAASIKGAIDRNELLSDATFYRGVADYSRVLGVKDGSDAVGMTIKDPAFLSVSGDPSVASKFMLGQEGQAAVFVIDANKGAPALSIGAQGLNSRQYETLFQQGSSLEVTKFVPNGGTDGGRSFNVFYARLLPAQKIASTEIVITAETGGDDRFVWGSKSTAKVGKRAVNAAGVMYHAPSGKVLFLLRATKGGDAGGTWAFPGGGVEAGESDEQAVARECSEEIGFTPDTAKLTLAHTGSNGYRTFSADVDDEFTPRLNHEHDGYEWADPSDPPQPLHPGVHETLKALGYLDKVAKRRAAKYRKLQPLSHDRPDLARLQAAMQALWTRALGRMGKDAKHGFAAKAGARKVAKAEPEAPDSPDSSDERRRMEEDAVDLTDAQIEGIIDSLDLTLDAGERADLEMQLRDAAGSSITRGYAQVGLGLDDAGDAAEAPGAEVLGDTIFEQLNQDALDWAKEHAAELVTQIDENTRDAVREAIVSGMDDNLSTGEIADALAALGVFDEDRADLIANTEIAFANSYGALEGYKQSSKDYGVKTLKQWLVANGEGICEDCQDNADAGAIPLDDEFPDGSDAPPSHPNCLPGDSRVLAEDVSSASKRWYDGDLVVILTASGKNLRCTPNHPVLTPHGWVAAGLVDKGSYVVSSNGAEWSTLAVDLDANDVPPRIEDVAEALGRSGHVTAMPVPTSAEDFHGDGEGSKVAVIWADRALWHRADAALGEQAPKGTLQVSHSTFDHVRASAEGLLVKCLLSSARSHMRSLSLSSALLRIEGGHAERVGSGCPAPIHPGQSQRSFDAVAVNPEAPCDGLLRDAAGIEGRNLLDGQRRPPGPDADSIAGQCSIDDAQANARLSADLRRVHAGDVFLDAVVSVHRVRFSGHVYNLQTSHGFYVGSGVIVHNCRCAIAPVVSEENNDQNDEGDSASDGGDGEDADKVAKRSRFTCD